RARGAASVFDGTAKVLEPKRIRRDKRIRITKLLVVPVFLFVAFWYTEHRGRGRSNDTSALRSYIDDSYDIYDTKVQTWLKQTLPNNEKPIPLRCLFKKAPLERKQYCCEFLAAGWKCLPNLIVIGSQKGGSTATHAYLLSHSQ